MMKPDMAAHARCRGLLVLSLVLLLHHSVLAQTHRMMPSQWSWGPVFTVPRLQREGRIDGVLADNEWMYATQVAGAVDAGTQKLSSQRCRFLLGYRGQDLWLGFDFHRPKGSGPPRTIVNDAGWSAKPLWVKDENLEVWLAPFADGVALSGMMTPCYAIAANAAGAYSHNLTGWDRSDIPRDLRYVPILRGEHWQGEMQIPWTTLSQMRVAQPKSAPKDGVEWRGAFFFQQLTPARALIGTQHCLSAFPVLRFSERPVGYGASSVQSMEGAKAHFSADVRNGSDEPAACRFEYMVFKRRQVPQSREEHLVAYCRWIHRIQAVGPAKAAQERGGVLDVRTVPRVEDDLNRQYVCVASGDREVRAAPMSVARETVTFDAPDGYYVLWYRMTDFETDRVVMEQMLPVLLARLPVQARAEFLKAQVVVVRANVGAVAGAGAGDLCRMSLEDGKGQVLASRSRKLEPGTDALEAFLSTKQTSPGTDYAVRVQVVSKDKVLGETVTPIHRPKTPEWFDSGLGLTDRVPAGFEPVRRVDDGFELALRRLVMTKCALPEQILTRGKPLLADPIQLTAQVGGRPVAFTMGRLRIVETTPTAALFAQRWDGAGLVLDISGRLEYDGCTRYDVQLSTREKGLRVEALTLVVPVKAEYAKWFSHRDLGTRMAGGLKGPFFPYGSIADFFANYHDGWMPFTWQIFLGTHDRGIEWVAESDRAWEPHDETRMIGLLRGEDRVAMVFKFIDAPAAIDEPRTFTFALTPTPVRDYPRERYHEFSRSNGASLSPATSQNPLEDPATVEIYRELEALGIRVAHHYTNFGPDLFSNVRFYEERHLRPLRIVHGLARKHGLIGVHYCGYSLPPGIPDSDTFGDEMRMEPAYRGWYNHASPFADYWLHGAKFMCEKANVTGFHTDGLSMVWLMSNPTYGFRWQRNGEAHGTYPVFAVRSLLKRFYHMLKFEVLGKGEYYHFPHVTDAPVYCLESFSDIEVTGEQHYNTISTLSDLMPRRYRLCYDTLGHGIPRMGIWSYTKDVTVTKCMMLALHNLHGVMYHYVNLRYSNHPYEMMGGFRPEALMWKQFDRRKAAFMPYWAHPSLASVRSDTKGVSVPEDAIKVSAYVHRDTHMAVLIVANIDTVGYSIRLGPALQALGLPGHMKEYSCIDPILHGNYHYPAVGDELRLDLYPQRWRAVWLRKR